MNPDIMEKINKFSRRPLSEDEVFVFSVTLCDNDIDRDCERFSDYSLEQIAEKFVGRTGISDHDPSAANQTARIFDAEVVTDSERKSKTGDPYKYVRAQAYMIRTDENRSLIAEIDGGIKKEVSISCSAGKRICSVCGCEKGTPGCVHVKGKLYGGKLAHTVLDEITDAYEWSFVAVPAQVNAGVTKRFSSDDVHSVPVSADVSAADEELRRDIRRLAFFKGGRAAADITSVSAKTMDTRQLIALKKSLERQQRSSDTAVQLCTEKRKNESDETSAFFVR